MDLIHVVVQCFGTLGHFQMTTTLGLLVLWPGSTLEKQSGSCSMFCSMFSTIPPFLGAYSQHFFLQVPSSFSQDEATNLMSVTCNNLGCYYKKADGKKEPGEVEPEKTWLGNLEISMLNDSHDVEMEVYGWEKTTVWWIFRCQVWLPEGILETTWFQHMPSQIYDTWLNGINDSKRVKNSMVMNIKP